MKNLKTGLKLFVSSLVFTSLTAFSAELADLSPDTEADRISWIKLEQKYGKAPDFPKDAFIGAIVKTKDIPFWDNIDKGYMFMAQKMGVKLECQAAKDEEDPIGQLDIAETLLAKKVTAILASPQTDVTLQLPFEEALGAKIPFINVSDAVVPQTRYFVGGMHYRNGMDVAEWFLEKYPKGGEVAVIEGLPLVYATTQRSRGFINTLKKNHEFKVVEQVCGNWAFDDAKKLTEEIVSKHPNIIGIYCHNDVMALGAVEALKKKGRLGSIPVFGTDGIAQAYESIEKGELTGTVDSFPEVTGAIAVQVAARILKGQSIPRVVVTPQQLITKDNFKTFQNRDIDFLMKELAR
ncbi:MAG: substrate-binding domain-containing protein [Succinivibrio dextrinosolvens]|uniref:Ribose transport system substrate-binding protein n=1 Tax=Succinivibrio dextrinosolvens TaxID=83771 RepID=A0A662ZB43_9GAMM|nr:substrate-binding domain-containing protein [Succinivibrio dextrinosolvens]MDY6421366.1 substrate-binding domain-containing protein [Succinivibrio dextrinosolvens]MDY6466135.1 substrate-binding domain-containing protein [Succinivibrio dextrinosolvens]SFK06199.1 ribose transport system substrate-binding protein [Succinivibrio dextrinosolvens]